MAECRGSLAAVTRVERKPIFEFFAALTRLHNLLLLLLDRFSLSVC